jgi:hypothetical protein
VALVAATAVTKRIMLSTGICLVIERDPIVLAEEVASLDRISDGRVISRRRRWVECRGDGESRNVIQAAKSSAFSDFPEDYDGQKDHQSQKPDRSGQSNETETNKIGLDSVVAVLC